MRRIVFDAEAERELVQQIDYLIDRHALDAATRLERRVRSFLVDHLAVYPATGKRLDHRALWETWIPRTQLVVWYRFSDYELQIVHFWHSAQDRS